MVWEELDRRVKENQPTNAQHMWELLQDCWKSIAGEAGFENAKSVQSCHQGKGWLYFDLFSHIFGYYMIPYMLFHSLDVFTIIPQCRKL